MSQSGEKSILERIASGDQQAVSDCLDRYGRLVWFLATRYNKRHADAEDATQEIFMEIWKNSGRFQSTLGSEETFITMIARRRLIDRCRRASVQPETMQLTADDAELSDLYVEDQAELTDEAMKASECLRKLSEEQHQVITLSIQQGVSHDGISRKLGMPLGTVKSYARRALLQLRDCMSRTVMVLNAAEGNVR